VKPEPKHDFIEMLRPLRASLEGYSRRLLLNASDVEDVLQSALFHAFQKWDDFQAGTNFKAWVFKFVTHECLNANRRSRKIVPLESIEEVEVGVFAAPEGLHESYETLLSQPSLVLEQCGDALYHAVRNLSDIERSVFLLRAVGDFSYKEIADLLNIPMGSVMGYLFRARNRLRHALCAEAGRVAPIKPKRTP
jgi:RNA polymerase sigma-70 factor (ECF subfamily)